MARDDADATTDTRKDYVLYDGACPACSRYIAATGLASGDDIALIDARGDRALVAEHAAAGRRIDEVMVAEATGGIGSGVSSRNSEVIHAGLYCPTGSKRALHCPRGRRMLYDFCASHGVPHRNCGKLVVATNESEIPRLDAVYRQAA